jgi:hypothetical protein
MSTDMVILELVNLFKTFYLGPLWAHSELLIHDDLSLNLLRQRMEIITQRILKKKLCYIFWLKCLIRLNLKIKIIKGNIVLGIRSTGDTSLYVLCFSGKGKICVFIVVCYCSTIPQPPLPRKAENIQRSVSSRPNT